MQSELFSRSRLLLGEEKIHELARRRVILFGVGGVGSWCAESLVRNGIHYLTLVDSDRVAASNCNRQLMATTRTIGQPKVEALRQRLLDINPEARITALQQVYDADTADSFGLETYDVIIDAIDSLAEKGHLILHATRLAQTNRRILFLSSMGAALRTDPTRIRVAEFWKVQGDPLARALRNRFKREKTFPPSKFLCVYSEEPPLPNLGEAAVGDVLAPDPSARDWHTRKVQINGSLSHITGIFGLTLAGLAIR